MYVHSRVKHDVLNMRWTLKGGLVHVHAVLGELVTLVVNHASISMQLLTSII